MLRRSFLPLAGAFALLPACARGAPPAAAPQDKDDPFLVELQERTFRWFWDVTPVGNGLTPDRWPTPSFSSIAAVGFALTAYGVGVERGWISRDQALARTLATLRFFDTAPQGPAERDVAGHKGFFYHFLDQQSGFRFEQVELSSIDTTLLLGGVLFAQSYFDRDTPGETEVRRLADRIYGRVDWPWMSPRAPIVCMGWHPEEGFISSDWNEFNEAALLYILGLGSPTHALPDGAWQAWTARFDRQWGAHWGERYIHFPALFVYQYSQVWVDFRGIRDAYGASRDIDYFENSRRATYAQRNYAIANPHRCADYSAEIFGLTACDGPGGFVTQANGRRREFHGYAARGPGDIDDGTLAPTALGGAVPFAPELAVPALKAMHARYGDDIYGRYGFLDAFNPTLRGSDARFEQGRLSQRAGWVDADYLGIDQGPIVCMIENWRSGFIWDVMRKSPYIRRGLTRAGFTGGWLAS